MMKLTAVAAVALLTLTVQGTAHAQMPGLTGVQSAQAGQDLVHKTGRRNRDRVAASIALGIIDAAAIAHGSRHYYDDRDDWRHERRCRCFARWRRCAARLCARPCYRSAAQNRSSGQI